jgi:mannose/fructose/N-acetylgalactosamine-specific phosphotransferase system component IIC
MNKERKPDIRRGELAFIFAIVLGLLVGIFIRRIRVGLIIGVALGLIIVGLGASRSSRK